MKLKTVPKSKIEIHKAALPAFLFDKFCKTQIEVGFFQEEEMSSIMKYEIPVTINNRNKGKYLVISNWKKFIFQNIEQKIDVLVISDDLSNNQIENTASRYIINNQLLAWHSNSSMHSLDKLLNLLPDALIENYKKTHKTNSRIKLISLLTNKSDTAIRNKINQEQIITNGLNIT